MVKCTPTQPGRPWKACGPATPTSSLSSQRRLSTTPYDSTLSVATSTTRSSTTSLFPVSTSTPPVRTSATSNPSPSSESSFKTFLTPINSSSQNGPTTSLSPTTTTLSTTSSVVVSTTYNISDHQLNSIADESRTTTQETWSASTSSIDESTTIVSRAPSSVFSLVASATNTTEPVSSAGVSTTSQGNSSGGSRRNNADAIAGGLLGGLVFLIIVLTALVILRGRLRARRTAPSAQFMHIARRGDAGAGAPSKGGGTPEWFHADRLNGAATPVHDQLLSHAHLTESAESSSEGHPPPPGRDDRYYVYPTDPVLQKAREAAGTWELYRRRSESFATAHELSLHEDESEGHTGSAEDEKGGCAFAL